MAYECSKARRKNILLNVKNGKDDLAPRALPWNRAEVLVTEDVVTTGGSVKEVIALLNEMGVRSCRSGKRR